MQTKLIFCLIYLTLISVTGCENNQQPSINSKTPVVDTNNSSKPVSNLTLKQKYADHFFVGAAADSGSYISHANLLKTHFSSLTTENEMKFESLQNIEGVFTYETADKMFDFATENNMATRGHALVWHRQSPSWLFANNDGVVTTKDALLDKMKTHITNVVRHFKGKVDVWDVVNEAIMDDGSWRTEKEERDDQKSQWYGIIGESYIAEAFKAAHAADPQAKLFYNDYYNYIPARRDAIYNLLKGLLDAGVPIHGVGLQCHISIERSSNPEHQSYQQSIDNIENAIKLYASLGLEVHITELDMSVYVGGKKYETSDFYTAENIPETIKIQQAKRYAALFKMFRRNSDVITNVTFWGIADDNTWLSEFDSGRTDFPMLFDIEHQPKKAFHSVVDF